MLGGGEKVILVGQGKTKVTGDSGLVNIVHQKVNVYCIVGGLVNI